MISRFFECVIPAKNTNKFYNVHLKKTPSDNFIVTCEYGRRAHSIVISEKLFSDFNSARNYFDKVVLTRFKHEYEEVHFMPVADIPFNNETNEHYKERCREIKAGLDNPLLTGGDVSQCRI